MDSCLDHPQTESTRWCAGLPQTGERELTPVERARIGRQARNGRRATVALALGFPILFLAVLAGLSGRNPYDNGVGTALTFFAIVMMVGSVLVILLSRDFRARSRGLAGDLREGRVHIYSRALDDPAPENEAQRFLLKWAFPSEAPDQVLTIEVLPVSHRVLQVNSVEVNRWITIAENETGTPAFARLAAEWLQLESANDETEVYSGRRELSPAERLELNRIQRALRRRALPAVVFALFFALIALSNLSPGDADKGIDWAALGFFAILTLINVVVFIRRSAFSRRIAADTAQGVVLILRIASRPTPDEAPDSDGVKEFEILPNSKTVWTDAGKPASWRTS